MIEFAKDGWTWRLVTEGAATGPHDQHPTTADEFAAAASLLGYAPSHPAEPMEGRWVNPREEAPEPGAFAWVVWNGTVQNQPWEWAPDADEEEGGGEPVWHYGGHEMPADEVDAYMPIKKPDPPVPDGDSSEGP